MLRYKEIKQLLMQEIGKREPMERLPSRTILCRQLDTTRTTLDKAIKELEREGFVYCRDGSGTYIASPHGFDPNTPQNWGVLVPDSTRDIFAALVRGVEEVTAREGVNLILCNCDEDITKQTLYLRRLLVTGVTGLIMVPVLREDVGESHLLYAELSECRTPFVFCHNGVSGITAPLVTSNNFYGGYLATKHLLERGYRRPAYIGDVEYRTAIERYQGFEAALRESGVQTDQPPVCFCGGDYHRIKDLFKRYPDIDSLCCFNDTVAGCAYRALYELGKRVSDDVGVIGYDNTKICDILQPPVTSLNYGSAEIGKLAAEVLLSQIRGELMEPFPYYVYHPTLSERESCKGVLV